MAKTGKRPYRSKEPYAFWISPEQKAALRAVKDRDGIPVSEQIRRAIDLWLEEEASERSVPRRATTRRKI